MQLSPIIMMDEICGWVCADPEWTDKVMPNIASLLGYYALAIYIFVDIRRIEFFFNVPSGLRMPGLKQVTLL